MRPTSRLAALFLAVVAPLTGCSSHEQARSLQGTSWQLLSIQSMDETQGTTAVPDPSKFTVEFAADGQAYFQINCNRGTGSYEAQPSGEGVSGTVTFGPIATTMMMCPEPELDQQVSTALTDVRTYLFKNDQLHLSTFADGGILTWKPAPSSPATTK